MKWLGNKRRAQTVLEYVLMIAVFAIPLAATLRELLSDTDKERQDNIIRRITTDSYGDERGFGVIGRPYP